MPGDIRENSSRLGCKREEFSFRSYVLLSENWIIIFRFRILNHLLAGIHEYYHTAIFAGRQAFVVFIVAHTFHLLELRGRYAAILQIILYGIGTVLGHLHVGFVRTDLSVCL